MTYFITLTVGHRHPVFSIPQDTQEGTPALWAVWHPMRDKLVKSLDRVGVIADV